MCTKIPPTVKRPTPPGPTDQKFLSGHRGVTLAWIVRHPRWGTIGLPLLAQLCVRQKDSGTIPVVIIAWLVYAIYLYHRSRELRKQFRETYPS